MSARQKFRALVVDDEDAIRDLMVRGLTQHDFECETAANGSEAEAMISQSQYDLVITDLRMPVKHGHALAV